MNKRVSICWEPDDECFELQVGASVFVYLDKKEVEDLHSVIGNILHDLYIEEYGLDK